MADHEIRRKIIRQWMALPKEKRQTEEQVAAFAKKAVQQNEFHRSRRDPSQKFRRDPYEKLMGWLLPRAGKSLCAITFPLGSACAGDILPWSASTDGNAFSLVSPSE